MKEGAVLLEGGVVLLEGDVFQRALKKSQRRSFLWLVVSPQTEMWELAGGRRPAGRVYRRPWQRATVSRAPDAVSEWTSFLCRMRCYRKLGIELAFKEPLLFMSAALLLDVSRA